MAKKDNRQVSRAQRPGDDQRSPEAFAAQWTAGGAGSDDTRPDGARSGGRPSGGRLDRRQFLGTGAVAGVGAGGLLASLGLSGCATGRGAAAGNAASGAGGSGAGASGSAASTSGAAASGPAAGGMSSPTVALEATTPPAVAEAAKVVAQTSAAAPTMPGRVLPPEPTVAQPAPLKDLQGKVAYISAASDGIGLGIARACSNAGMIVVIGYRNEERLKAALPLFKPGNPGVMPFKHDVTDRAAWAQLVAASESQVRQVASGRQQRRHQDTTPGEARRSMTSGTTRSR